VNIRPSSLSSQLEQTAASESIVVAVNGRFSGWQALEWAAAEAAARSAPLSIVHVLAPPFVLFDPLGGTGPMWIDSNAPDIGALILEEAERRTRMIAPSIAVTTHLECGRLAATLRDVGRDNALTVVGRSRTRRFGFLSASRRIARRATAPVAIVQLDDQRGSGPSAARIVLGIDNNAGPPSAVAYAFQAASRRGIGLTVIHACTPSVTTFDERADGGRIIENLRRLAAIDAVLQTYRDAYPHVDVRRRFVPGSAGAALAAESIAAALLVIGAQPLRYQHPSVGSVARAALRWAQSPIAIVRPTGSDCGRRS
jgi:nucleotide-binding universal stress UspA family protein